MKKMIMLLLAVMTLASFQPGLLVKAAETEQEIYGIGSVSKIFGAAAIMLLNDRGEVLLDHPVTEYIPEFKMADERYRQITVRMLLNHSSGLMGTTFKNCFLYGDADVDYHMLLLSELKKQKLKADPGEYSVYCNDGFTLAEIIVERVSGMSFAQFIKQEFTNPLSMKQTFMPSDLPEGAPVSPIYYKNFALPRQNILSLASGGIYSTPKDLCLFAELFMENDRNILSGQAVSEMASPEYLSDKICAQKDDSNFNYGLGWDSVDVYPFSRYGIKALSKGGDTGNFGAALMVLPEQNLSVSVTASGGESAQCLTMAGKVATEILLKEGLITADQELNAVAVDKNEDEETVPIPDELQKYQGTYASSEIFELTFTDHNTAKITSLENNSDMVQEYRYTKEGRFVSTEGNYISYTGLAQASNGILGRTEFYFSEEANGKTYLLGTTYVLSGKRAENAVTMPLAEKIEENRLPGPVLNVWEKRNNCKYYLVNEVYNSSNYLKMPCTTVEILNKFKGYTGTAEIQKNCRILDADHAVCELNLSVMAGRDLSSYRFYRDSDTEYLDISGFTLIEESAIPPFTDVSDQVTMGQLGKWYQISSEDAGSQIWIETPENAAFYIYDQYDICTVSSIFADKEGTLLLPKGGKILFAGEEGSTFLINRHKAIMPV